MISTYDHMIRPYVRYLEAVIYPSSTPNKKTQLQLDFF
jgi:hypothetical protein